MFLCPGVQDSFPHGGFWNPDREKNSAVEQRQSRCGEVRGCEAHGARSCTDQGTHAREAQTGQDGACLYSVETEITTHTTIAGRERIYTCYRGHTCPGEIPDAGLHEC